MHTRKLDRYGDPIAPGGVDGLSFVHAGAPFDKRKPDLNDCLVDRPKPFRLIIWEPLNTKAPGPHLSQPYCCYINTVIFYHRPYIPKLAKSHWRDMEGNLRTSEKGSFEEWDKIQSRFRWEDLVSFQGEEFEIGAGEVLWANRQWWERRHARRKRESI